MPIKIDAVEKAFIEYKESLKGCLGNQMDILDEDSSFKVFYENSGLSDAASKRDVLDSFRDYFKGVLWQMEEAVWDMSDDNNNLPES